MQARPISGTLDRASGHMPAIVGRTQNEANRLKTGQQSARPLKPDQVLTGPEITRTQRFKTADNPMRHVATRGFILGKG
jgi:hypothetical protein